MGIGKAVGQVRHVRALAVLQIEDRVVGLKLVRQVDFLVVRGGLGGFLLGLFLSARHGEGRERVDVGIWQDGAVCRRVGHHAGRQHDHVEALQRHFLAQQHVVDGNGEVGADALDLALHEDDAGFLGLAVELLRRAGRAQFVVDDVDHRLGIGLAQLQGVLDRHAATNGRTIRQMVGIARAGALDERDVLGRRAIGFTADCAVRQHVFQFDIGHHIGRSAVAQVPELVRIVGPPAGRHDDGADFLNCGRAALADLDVELAGPAGGLGDLRIEAHVDPAVGLDRGDQVGRVIVLQPPVRRLVRHAFGPLGCGAAEFVGAFDQHDVVARPGRLSRRVETRRTAAHDQHGPGELTFRHRFGRVGLVELGDRHADVIVGLGLGFLIAVLVAPGHLFAQVGAHDVVAVKTEAVGVDALRTSPNDDLVDGAGGDVAADHRHAFVAAEIVVRLAERHLEFVVGHAFDLGHINGLTDAAAGAEIDARVLFDDCLFRHYPTTPTRPPGTGRR